MHEQGADVQLLEDDFEPTYVILVRMSRHDEVHGVGAVVSLDVLQQGLAVVRETTVDDYNGLLGTWTIEVTVAQRYGITAPLLGDRSFDHDNDTEREDGIHRMDAHIVADEETVKAADDPHMLDFRP